MVAVCRAISGLSIVSLSAVRRETQMINELDMVVLTHDISEHGLQQGDVGAVVHVYSAGAAFEVEFATAEGRTIAVLTLTATDVRPMAAGEILHVREVMPLAA
jgi:uncharacterized protein DUF4926